MVQSGTDESSGGCIDRPGSKDIALMDCQVDQLLLNFRLDLGMNSPN